MRTIIKKEWNGRFPSKQVSAGNTGIGGDNPVRLQSMTNTSTLNIKETADQCLRMIDAGADLVRISVPNKKSATSLKEIKKQIRKAGYDTPLVADIHYNPDIALIAARVAEKIRINPGNYGSVATFNKKSSSAYDKNKELEIIHNNISPLLSVCREYGTAIRIGTNHGSLSQRILFNYGNTAEGMVQATLEYLQIFEDNGFYDIIISLKSSSPMVMVDAYRQIAEQMLQRKKCYPLHLGVTEAGAQEEGRVRSAIGICSLMNDGIGDTIRVSLSEKPENEILFAKKIVDNYHNFYEADTGNPLDLKPKEKFDKFDKIENIRKNVPVQPFDKPVVISALKEEDTPNQNHKANSLSRNQKPDFFYSKKITNPEISNLIIPFSLWKKNKTSESYPVFSVNEIERVKQFDAKLKFIHLKISEITDDLIKDIRSTDSVVLILETDFTTLSDFIIEISDRIYKLNQVPLILKNTYTSGCDTEDMIIKCSKLHGYFINEEIIKGLWIDAGNDFSSYETSKIAFSILQATEKRITTNQYISCPTCARTAFNLQKILEQVKKQTRHIKGLKIAVMGCVVNGPGEMADADYGLVGAGNKKIHLYKKQQIIKKNIDEDNAVKELLNLMAEFEDNS